jgi:multiple sugar transport system substrate-binding protein
MEEILNVLRKLMSNQPVDPKSKPATPPSPRPATPAPGSSTPPEPSSPTVSTADSKQGTIQVGPAPASSPPPVSTSAPAPEMPAPPVSSTSAPPPPPAAPSTPSTPSFKPHLPPPPPPPPSTPDRPAVPMKSSPFKFLVPLLLIGIIILVAVLVGQRLFGSRLTSDPSDPGKIVTITYWGLWEPLQVMQEVIGPFEDQNPGIKINYQQQSVRDYRERLQNNLANNQGPDIYRFHLTWAPLLAGDLMPVPKEILTAQEFEDQQYPVARAWLRSSKGYLGIPLMFEGLGLFYNQEIFEAAGAVPPKTWTELRPLAIKLTIPDSAGGVQRGGIALGTTSNVDNWSDILGLLLLQNAANPAKPNNQLGQDAFTFYSLFVQTDKVWSEAMPSSTVAFANGKVAMIIAPSWRAHEVREMNPNLKFAIAPVPQLPDTQVSWASPWVEGVSAHSDRAKQQAAWKFLQYMNQKDTLRIWYAAASKERLFGEMFGRRDMADQLATDPMLGAFIAQAPYAKTWFLNSRTFDNGPNDRIIKYYEDALNSMTGRANSGALATVEQGIDQILSQYRLPHAVPQP